VAPILFVLAAGLAGAAFSRAYSAPAANAPQLAVEQRLMCPQCLQTRLDVCDTPICSDMKADVARRLSAGESQDSIVSSYRQAYGDSILSNEQPAGLAAWVPWTVAAAGLAGLAFLALRRRAGPPRVAAA
jgi:cytochrome c-type biogenesis protein CcmH/NrfF